MRVENVWLFVSSLGGNTTVLVLCFCRGSGHRVGAWGCCELHPWVSPSTSDPHPARHRSTARSRAAGIREEEMRAKGEGQPVILSKLKV